MSATAYGLTCVIAPVVRASLCRVECLARGPAVLSDCVLVFVLFSFCIAAMNSSKSAAELWATLPRRFRAEYGSASGLVPSACVLAFLVDSADDMASLVAQYAPGDAHLSNVARALWAQAQGEASAACKRRSLVDPAWQRVLLARRLPQSETTVPGLCDTLSWLRSKSGACRRSGKLLLRGPKQLSRVEDGQSREAVDKQRLLHWRRELAELVSEAGLPIAAQAQLASAPEEIIVASQGAMRASTIRKKVREWRKLRNFCLGACGCPWPSHVGVVLDYLRERVDEHCGRTVPEAVVSAFAFMEKVGCVPGAYLGPSACLLRKFCEILLTRPHTTLKSVPLRRGKLRCCPW